MLALSIAAAVWLVWHRALDFFFSQDDFASLGRAAGMVPRLHGPWRYVGIQLTFDLLHSVAGLNPLPYHLVSLLVHAGCSLLLFALLVQRVSRPAALVATVFFAVHPALMHAVYWISVLCDSLALLFGLAALVLLERPAAQRWGALPLFALSLLSKESTLLLPAAAIWLARRDAGASTAPPGRSGLRGRLAEPVRLGLAALSAAYLIYFSTSAYATYFVPAGTAAAASTPSTAAYSLGIGAGLLWNFLTLTGWAVNFALPTVRGFADAVDPGVYPWAAGATVVWLLGLRSAPLRRGGWLTGGVLYLLFVLPVLPLAHHTYHYYLYAPIAGLAWCVAALVETATARFAAAGRWLAGLAIAALLAWNGYAMVLKNETMLFLVPELRSDPVIDRARVAGRVCEDLGASNLPPGTRLAFWSPTLGALRRPAGPDSGGETYMERNVRTALLDGLAVRVMYPQVDTVAFVRDYHSLPDPWRYAVYRLDGSLRVATSAELDTVLTRFPATRGPALGTPLGPS